MSYQIDLKVLKDGLNAVLDHLIEDLKQSTIEIEADEDFYWHVPWPELSEMSRKPAGIDVGRLSDDFDFVRLIQRGQTGDVGYNLVHVAPLLRYVGEKVKR